jgi:hypothetical protein
LPAKQQAVARGTGTSTCPDATPSGSKRNTRPPPYSATQIPPSSSTASPSGMPSSSGITANGRRFSTWPDATSKSSTSTR